MTGPTGAEWVVWRPTAAAANRVSRAVRFLHQPGCLPGALGAECWGLLFSVRKSTDTTIPYRSKGIKPCSCYNSDASAPLDYITLHISTIFVANLIKPICMII